MRRGVPSDRGEFLACEIFQIIMNYNKKEINHSLQATSYGRYAEGLCGIMNACLRMLFLGEAALSYSAVPRSQASAPSRESGYRRPCAPICEDWLTLPRQSAAPSWLLSTASDSPPPLYRAEPDPYCYEGSEILKNKAGLTDSAALKQFETAMTFARAHEPLPRGRFSVSHYRAVHRHLFQDVYRWAGAFRTVRLSKGGNVFCYPEHISDTMSRLFAELKRKRYLRDLSQKEFAADAAHFLSELNAIHPFREGNGRTQLTFLALLADRAGHPLHLESMDSEEALRAMIRSFAGDEKSLVRLIEKLVRSYV